jgi:hypothetical protein
MSLESRFWAKVDKTGACWLWTAATDAKGYGHFALGTREDGVGLAHRVAWWLIYGAWPNGVLDHLCFNPNCVNPAHLDDISAHENTLRGESGRPWRERQCRRGHDWTIPGNVRMRSDGRHECKQCARERRRQRHA